MKMLSGMLPSFDKQIKKAIDRNDFVSVNHRTAAFVAVSYTHLDVYKRQMPAFRDKLNNRFVKKTLSLPAWLADRADKDGVNSVSYTHLDVYKRQHLLCD